MSLSGVELAELAENTVAVVVKLLYGMVWQEGFIDLSPWNLTPEANAWGAELLPRINQFANNLTRSVLPVPVIGISLFLDKDQATCTHEWPAWQLVVYRWELGVEDVQEGAGYPGSPGCNAVIPHAKWHVQVLQCVVLECTVLYRRRPAWGT